MKKFKLGRFSLTIAWREPEDPAFVGTYTAWPTTYVATNGTTATYFTWNAGGK